MWRAHRPLLSVILPLDLRSHQPDPDDPTVGSTEPLDLQINLLAEQESTHALKMLHAIAEHLEVADLPTEESLATDTSIRALIDDVQEVAD